MVAMLKKFSTVFLVLVVSLSGGVVAAAQQAQGSAQLTGAVAPALRLSLAGPASFGAAGIGPRATVESNGPSSVQVILSGGQLANASRLSLPLELRTNVAYQLKLAVISSRGCLPEIVAGAGAIRASGALVTPGAADEARSFGQLGLPAMAGPSALVSGARVSTRGGFGSGANALLIDLNLSISEHHSENCSWQAILRVTLEPRS